MPGSHLPRLHPLIWGATALTLGVAGGLGWQWSKDGHQKDEPGHALKWHPSTANHQTQETTNPAVPGLPVDMTAAGLVVQKPASAPSPVNKAHSPSPAGALAQTVERDAAVPSFRPAAVRTTPGGTTHFTPGPVALEFSASARFPAILAAPSTGGPPPGKKQLAAEAQILDDFITAVQPENSICTLETGLGMTTGDSTLTDERWEEAARIADGQARIFLGHDGYLQKSLEAALLKHQLPPPTEQ